MPIWFDNQGKPGYIREISVTKQSELAEKGKGASLEIPESEARKRIRDFIIRLQNLPKIFESARPHFLDRPGLLLFLRNPPGTHCEMLLMRFDFWYNRSSSRSFVSDCYIPEPNITCRRAHNCQFYCSVFKIEERPCVVFCEENKEPINYIVIGSAALKILMRGGRQTRLFAIMDFLDILWFTGFSPFQMSENTIRDMLVWVSVGGASKKKPKDLRRKHRTLWKSFRINRVPFWDQKNSNGGETAK